MGRFVYKVGELGKHSEEIGGMIAVEIARALAGRGAEVAFLGVIDTAARGTDGGYLDPAIPFWRLPRAGTRTGSRRRHCRSTH